MINIVIADNQVLTREGIAAILSEIKDIDIIGKASTSAELTQLLHQLKPDVIIMGDDFGDGAYIHKRAGSLPVLVLSNNRNRKAISDLVNKGIKNHLLKKCSSEELVRAVYYTARGKQFFCTNTFEILFGNKLIPEKEQALPSLSLRETELIQLIAEGLTNKEIAEKLFLSVHTIKTHRKNIIKKLGFTFKNTAELAAFIQKP